MNCWKCQKLISEMPIKVGFRAICQHCGIDLHTCAGCRYYTLGKPNDCAVPGTDFVRDREAMNFCEEFAPKLVSSPSSTVPKWASLGEPQPKKEFKSLFKDEDS
jgi:hypothetical protein